MVLKVLQSYLVMRISSSSFQQIFRHLNTFTGSQIINNLEKHALLSFSKPGRFLDVSLHGLGKLNFSAQFRV